MALKSTVNSAMVLIAGFDVQEWLRMVCIFCRFASHVPTFFGWLKIIRGHMVAHLRGTKYILHIEAVATSSLATH